VHINGNMISLDNKSMLILSDRMRCTITCTFQTMYGILEHDRITLTIGYVNVTILCRMLRSGVPIKVESISICYPSSMQCKLRQAVDYILIDLTKKLAERKRTAYREPMQGKKNKEKNCYTESHQKKRPFY